MKTALLVTITFGIVEYSGAYHDSAITADAVRAGGRVGSALATDPSYTTNIADAVDSALATLPANVSRLSLYQSSNGAASGLSHSNFGNSAALTFSVVYDV